MWLIAPSGCGLFFRFAIDANDGWTDALSSGKDMNIISVAR